MTAAKRELCLAVSMPMLTLAFVLVADIAGAAGATGATGVSGPAGATGATGPRGLPGKKILCFLETFCSANANHPHVIR